MCGAARSVTAARMWIETGGSTMTTAPRSPTLTRLIKITTASEMSAIGASTALTPVRRILTTMASTMPATTVTSSKTPTNRIRITTEPAMHVTTELAPGRSFAPPVATIILTKPPPSYTLLPPKHLMRV